MDVVEVEEGAAHAAEQEVARLPESHSRPRCCRGRRRLWERERAYFSSCSPAAGLGFKWAGRPKDSCRARKRSPAH